MWEIKTNIGKSLKDSLYPILSTELDDIRMSFIDFKCEDEFDIGSPNIYTKDIKLKTVPVEIIDDNDIETSLSNHLDSEFIQLVKYVSIKNRISNKIINENFDISIEKLINEFGNASAIEKIIFKLNNCSSYIATNGRIGPAQYIITSEKINNFILSEENINNVYFKLYINRNIENENIIVGRKNDIDQPGISLIINENSFNDITSDNGKLIMNLKYKFSVNGFYPEKQYFLIKNI